MNLLWPIAGNLPITQTSDDHIARGGGPAVDFAAWSSTEWLSCSTKVARVVKSAYDSEQGHLDMLPGDAKHNIMNCPGAYTELICNGTQCASSGIRLTDGHNRGGGEF